MEMARAQLKHINPVYGSYFADPFVWEHRGAWFAIGTGELEAKGQTLGKIFPVLQSSDFFQWQFASNALIRPDPALGDNFWAPAVAVVDNRFYLYYSVGHGDKNHQLRVAVSGSPQGPYEDIGQPLIDPADCAFAIDPHPFRDHDGAWYLFFARDYLDTEGGCRAGTGLAAIRLKTMTEVEGRPQTILRARSDWQRFQSQRPMYGGTWDWHTLEGPCVTRHDGRYYCFYSGGRWENDSYGVDYGVAQNILGPYSDAGSETGPRVLKTVPGHVLGPGHNSTIRGPDGNKEFIVYHAWDKQMKARQMFLDRLLWTSEGPRCEGPTWGANWSGA
jgi:beta-xylosidase